MLNIIVPISQGTLERLKARGNVLSVVWPTLDTSVNRNLMCQYPISWYNNVTSPMRVAVGQLEKQMTIMHANLCVQ